MSSELDTKRRRLEAIMDAAGLDALILRRPGNVAWLSGGGRTHIVATPEVGVADVVVRRDGLEVVTAVNEAPRLAAEELGGLGAQLTILPWAEADRLSALPRGPRVGSDTPLPGTALVAAAVEEARRALLPEELDRYRALGRDAARVMTELCHAVHPDESEFDAAARLASLVIATGADPVVLLVAGEERLPVHRHALPTGSLVGRRAMFVVCARRHGLIANVTRFVSFGALSPAEADAYARLTAVDVAFNAATRPGARVGQVFAAGTKAYAAYGFDADEWTLHHQGGPTGYEGRDYLATSASDALVVAGQAFAWNPSVRGLKVEDTVVARADAPPEVLTVDERWPTITVEGLVRPLVLER